MYSSTYNKLISLCLYVLKNFRLFVALRHRVGWLSIIYFAILMESKLPIIPSICCLRRP